MKPGPDGLWLDPASLTSGDSARVLAVLQHGIGPPNHADFVARLNPRPPQTT
jgi:hypothetical protein